MADYDVIIIGSGPGGYLAAERLGAQKKRVLLVEKQDLGGTCLNIGCIPTKTLLAGAKSYVHAAEAAMFGVTAEKLSFDWSRMQEWKTEVVTKLRAGLEASEKKLGVEIIKGTGVLTGSGAVTIEGKIHTADAVIIATGSTPAMPPIPGATNNSCIVDSTGILAISELPKKLCVIGGGVIGVEFASLFSSLGVSVEVIEMLDEIVPFMDKDQAAILRRALRKVAFRLGAKVKEISGNKVSYINKDGSALDTSADLILIATGRKAVLEGWGALESGIDTSGNRVRVDCSMRTNIPGVWAIGDVTGLSQLAHAAYRMADVAVEDIVAAGNATKGKKPIFRSSAVPWVIYSLPEAAGVGLTEQEAKSRGIDTICSSLPMRISGRFCAENGFGGLGGVKLVAQRDDGRILGIHAVGSYSSEFIWGAAALIEQEMTIRDLREVIFPHPTVCEVIRDAAWEMDI